MTDLWDKLTLDQQNVFLDKAHYLIERRYVHGKTTNQLAKEIFISQLRNNDKVEKSNVVSSTG